MLYAGPYLETGLLTTLLTLTPAVVSWVCHNKLPHTRWLKAAGLQHIFLGVGDTLLPMTVCPLTPQNSCPSHCKVYLPHPNIPQSLNTFQYQL